jgi:hypothetical protein
MIKISGYWSIKGIINFDWSYKTSECWTNVDFFEVEVGVLGEELELEGKRYDNPCRQKSS